MIRAGLYYINC